MARLALERGAADACAGLRHGGRFRRTEWWLFTDVCARICAAAAGFQRGWSRRRTAQSLETDVAEGVSNPTARTAGAARLAELDGGVEDKETALSEEVKNRGALSLPGSPASAGELHHANAISPAATSSSGRRSELLCFLVSRPNNQRCRDWRCAIGNAP